MTLSAAPPASPAPPPRDLAMESSSSKNRMQGAACLACGGGGERPEGQGETAETRPAATDRLCRRSHLIKHLPDVGLRLSEPHGEHLGAFDGHKVCLALVGDGLGQQGLPTAWRAVEEHAAGRSHAELQELVRVLDGILGMVEGEIDGAMEMGVVLTGGC